MLSRPYPRISIPRSDIDIMMDMMIWAVKNHGPTTRPNVPKILKQKTLLSSWDDKNETPVFQWAYNEFERILVFTKMDTWSVQLLPDALLAGSRSPTPRPILYSQTNKNSPFPGYYVDDMGRPVFYYDPRQCHRPGYLLGHLLPKLATLKLYASDIPPDFRSGHVDMLLNVMAAHMGQGFAKLALLDAETPKPKSPFSISPPARHSAKQRLLFMTVLALSSRRYAPEQIIAHYGPILSKPNRKAIWPIYKMIEKETEFIKLLRVMTDNRLAEQGAKSLQKQSA